MSHAQLTTKMAGGPPRPRTRSQDARHRPARARPLLIVFDVNETLSDMSPLAARFEEVGRTRPPGADLVRRLAA